MTGRERGGLLLPAQEEPVAQRAALRDEPRHGRRSTRPGRARRGRRTPASPRGRARRSTCPAGRVADRLDERGAALLAAVQDEVLLGGEVVEDRLLGDVGGARDVGDGHRVEAARDEQRHRRLRDRLARLALLALAQSFGRGRHRGRSLTYICYKFSVTESQTRDRGRRPAQVLRRGRGGARRELRGRRRRGLRLPRAQRRGQDDDDQHALHARQADRRQRARRRPRRRARARRRPPPHRPRLPGPDARRLPDRRAEPAPARRALRRRVGARRPAGCAQVLEMVGLWERRDAHGDDLLRRHAPAAGDRARPHALAARALPRRADDRPRPADAQLDLALHPPSCRSARRSRSS